MIHLGDLAPAIVATLLSAFPDHDIGEFPGAVDGQSLRDFAMASRPSPNSTSPRRAAMRVAVIDGKPTDDGDYLVASLPVDIRWGIYIATSGGAIDGERWTAHKVAAYYTGIVLQLVLNQQWGIEVGDGQCLTAVDRRSVRFFNAAARTTSDRRVLEKNNLALWVVMGAQRVDLGAYVPDTPLPPFEFYSGPIEDQTFGPDQKPAIDLIAEIEQQP